MDYEKKYNDALKRAKAVMDVAANQDEARGIATTIFPELLESEDERIRKALIEFLREAYSRGNAPEECAKWLVWLDWQKEQKPTSFSEPYNPDDYEVVMEGNATNLKRKEQKPAEHSVKEDKYWHGFNEGKGTVLDNPGEYGLCKSAEWNEEDDWKRKELIQYLEEKGDYRTVWMTWLECLPERFNLQPKQEWSDNERIRKEINILYSDIDTCISELLKARTDKDVEAEGKALFKMEGLMVGTLQDLSCVETYLEKQKDASKAIEVVERIDKYIDEHVANAHDMKDSNPDKKYYRGWDDALGKMAGILQDVYSGEKQKEQPKEELVYRLNGLMQEYIKEGKDEAEKEHRFKCYQLFWDALEDTSYFEQKEQKTAEWSEEDLQHKSWILECLADREKKMPEYAEDFQAAYKWLKSLRPQPKQGIVLTEEQEKKFGHLFSYTYWKPSKEQMSALSHCAYGTCRIDDKPALQELYEQLKKQI